LLADVKLYLQDIISETTNYCEDFDKGHGRLETRKCRVSNNTQWLKERHPSWQSISSIACINSIKETKGKTSTEMYYYISSLENNTAEELLAAFRSHWAIENSIHWVLDMSFGKDQSGIRKNNAPQAMAVIRHLALNLLQLAKV